MKQLLVNQSDITEIVGHNCAQQTLQNGQVRLQIKRFALTANNVTYGASGHALGYWRFFPAAKEGYGIIPVWGFAEVVESLCDAVSIGARVYGFFPMAEQVVLTPDKPAAHGFEDVTPHRKALPAVYNRYALCRAASADQEGYQALLQPLLATSYLLSDWLSDNNFFNSKQIVVGSSSSKTGLGLCKFLAEYAPRHFQIIGLTSAKNAPFVRAQACCDKVVSYDAIATIAQVPSVYVDMAGNSEVKAQLHHHLAEHLKHSCAVGTSHWQDFKPKQALEGPKPQFFFAPSQIEKRRSDWGSGEIERKISAAWKRLARDAGGWLDLRVHSDLSAAAEVYRMIALGRCAPRDGHVVSL